MKIWNVNKIKNDVNSMIALFKSEKADIGYLTKLQKAVNFNKDIDVVDCATLFMLASVCEQITLTKEPNILVSVMEDLDKSLDVFQKSLKSPIYSEIKQNMYITLILSKPNGRKFAEGSLEFSDEEYKSFDNAIREEIAKQVEEINKRTGLKLNAIVGVNK